jgi:hypothetical protein
LPLSKKEDKGFCQRVKGKIAMGVSHSWILGIDASAIDSQ